MCEFVNEYLQDGNYSYVATVYPTCLYPKGGTANGTAEIKSFYSCQNPSKFIHKNVIVYSDNQVVGKNTQIQSFDKDCCYFYQGTQGGNFNGKFKYCKKNDQIVVCGKGYTSITGDIEKIKIIWEKTSNGYSELIYNYKKDEWSLIAKRIFTRV